MMNLNLWKRKEYASMCALEQDNDGSFIQRGSNYLCFFGVGLVLNVG
jgi:hypothetical protein